MYIYIWGFLATPLVYTIRVLDIQRNMHQFLAESHYSCIYFILKPLKCFTVQHKLKSKFWIPANVGQICCSAFLLDLCSLQIVCMLLPDVSPARVIAGASVAGVLVLSGIVIAVCCW